MTYSEAGGPAPKRSCFRCGGAFSTSDRERVCCGCRKPKATPAPLKKDLTFRERQIVDLVVEGKANKEIAYRLLLTEGTIKEYMNRIFQKVGVSNRTELAVSFLRAECEAATKVQALVDAVPGAGEVCREGLL